MATDLESWSEAAQQWVAWARAENHDAFWAYKPAFEDFVGAGSGKAVEIGCGEGRISRVLSTLGWTMTAVEPVAELLEAARAADSAKSYIEASAGAVPLPEGSFDLLVLYNVLMDVDDLDGVLKEAARLMRPRARLIVGLVHPIADLDQMHREHMDPGNYFDTHRFDVETSRHGLSMRFRGWRRPLSAYTGRLREAGFEILDLAEPRPDPNHPWTIRHPHWSALPLFLWIDARKRGS